MKNLTTGEIEVEKNCNRHYIITRADATIISGWSDGPHPECDTTDAICVNEQGGYQFRLHPGGEENPLIYTMDGIPLYKYVDGEILPRAEEDIEAERSARPEPPPRAQEQLRADVDFLLLTNPYLLEVGEINDRI